ncbi:ACP S-malonyltransferase [Aestuariispira insulae]|uniref:Malonyl CoA-acyl carrier protein transacylase n=1 Tax=Aestuariispira insulae TaxID=1461337 RepID=A0A3D9H3X8_9PROT|nr:ACP S-malonyltransferase [Aestuariispira insulae]RED44197.1 [acyl-carrier-protein] S-malonyltransferase [Aestuariispira insulae]
MSRLKHSPAVMLFPGQGAQSVGMGKSLAAQSPAAANLLDRADEILDFPLKEILQRGPVKLLTRTDILQASICTVSAMAWAVLAPLALKPVAMAGHSLGELSAYYAAGAFDFETFITLAAKRGALMQAAAEASGGTMVALTSRSDEMPTAAEKLLDEAGEADICLANINSGRQVVLSGDETALGVLADPARALGLRVTRLPVSGPWHSKAMSPAAEEFRDVLEQIDVSDIATPVWNSLDCRPVIKAIDIRERLARQIDRPVNWLGLMQAMRRDHENAIWIELAPGKILTGLLLDMDRQAQIFRSETAVQLRRLQQHLEECNSEGGGPPS